MASTLPIQRHNVEAYIDGKFLGYVTKITSTMPSVITEISTVKWGFNKRRALSIKRSATNSNICNFNDGKSIKKFYTSKDRITFKIALEE